MNQNTKQKRSAASWLAELAKGRHGGASPLPDALRMDGGLLGAALCAAQRVHLSLPPCDVPCAGQYPRPAAGQASDAAAGYGAGSFLRLV